MMRRGFTLLEVMMVVIVAAILFVAALPDPAAADANRVRSMATQIEADIANAQSMSISNPVDPIVIRVDPANDKYWLARLSDTSTPITNDRTGRAYVVTGGQSGMFRGVEIVGADFNGDDALAFDGVGVIDQDVPALFQLKCGDSVVEVATDPTTGTSRSNRKYSKMIPANSVAAASGKTRGVGNATSVTAREDGVAADADEEAARDEAVLSGVDDLLDNLIGR